MKILPSLTIINFRRISPLELEAEAQVWQAEGRRYDTKGVSGGSLASFFSHLNSGMTAILALCFHPQLALFSLHCTFFISIELRECGLSKKAINRYDIHERANCLTPLGSAPSCLSPSSACVRAVKLPLYPSLRQKVNRLRKRHWFILQCLFLNARASMTVVTSAATVEQ